MIDEAIYNHLITEPLIIVEVAAKNINWIEGSQSTTYPQITYINISSPNMYDSNDQWQRWRFFIVAKDRVRCRDIAKLVKERLNRFKGADEGLFGGMAVDYVEIIEDMKIEYRDDSKFEAIQDYRFCFH